MDCSFTTLPYKNTGYFNSLITDYLDQVPELNQYYQHPVTTQGVKAAIVAREGFDTRRSVLVDHLNNQYKLVKTSARVNENIASLADKNTFTVCTAHQPALFTGTLYFIYKILHAIKLAEQLTKDFPGKKFVPVYWMGSEDADLDELGKFYLGTDKIVWFAQQTGAVGKMKTKGLEPLIHRIEGELSVLPFGKELVEMLKQAYLQSPDIQTATFRLLDQLFAEYGLVVLIPDSASLKATMREIFEEDLFAQTASSLVSETIAGFPSKYKVQANPRDINLFYFKEDIRGRIEQVGNRFVVHTGSKEKSIEFSEQAIRQELRDHPERFSPNVILRGLYQEKILPNIAFVGGGGETAYWLELKNLFNHYKIPFPLLVLRNSFLITDNKAEEKITRMGFSIPDFFRSEQDILTALVTKNRNGQLKLEKEKEAAILLYNQLSDKVTGVDKSLQQHVEALRVKALKPLAELEKKMLRAEKRKHEAEQRQIQAIKSSLFPLNGLQERVENFMPYYARYGQSFISLLYRHSLTLEQEFGILVLK